MKGARSLSNKEIAKVINSFDKKNDNYYRDLALFILGIYTGFRISELLSIKIRDIYNYDNIADVVEVQRKYIKNKTESRQIPLHKNAKIAIKNLIYNYKQRGIKINPNMPLFLSREGGNKKICYVRGWQILKNIFKKAKLQGKLGTNVMRKTFCRIFMQTSNNDIFALQKALGHSSPSTTMAYVEIENEKINKIILNFNNKIDFKREREKIINEIKQLPLF